MSSHLKTGIISILFGVAIIMIFWGLVGIKSASAMDLVSSPSDAQLGFIGSYNFDESTYTCGGTLTFKYGSSTIFGLGWSDCAPNHFKSVSIIPLSSSVDWIRYNFSNSNYSNGFAGNWSLLYNKSTLTKRYISDYWNGVYDPNTLNYGSVFITGSTIIHSDGTNLIKETFDDSLNVTTVETINMVTRFGHNISPTSYPTYLHLDASIEGWGYRGTDGKIYFLDKDLTSDIPLGGDSWTNAGIYGPIAYSDYLLGSSNVGSGTVYVPYGTSTGLLLDSSVSVWSINSFVNPKVYMTSSSGSVYSWDMNCKTQGYDSCVVSGGVSKCANNAGTLSPGGEICSGTVSVTPPPPSSGSGSSGTGGSTSFQTNTTTNVSNGYVGCKTVNYPIFGSDGYSLGNGTFSDSTTQYAYGWNYLSGSNSYMDRFHMSGFMTGSVIDTDTFLSLSANKNTTIVGSEAILGNGRFESSLSVDLTRNGTYAPVNYVKIKTNNPGMNVFGYGYSNVVANVYFYLTDGSVVARPMTSTGGYATALSANNARRIVINFLPIDLVFSGFEIGLSSGNGTISKTSCGNQYYSCNFNQQSPGVFACVPSSNPSGTSQGTCVIDGGICKPATQTGAYFDGQFIKGVTTVQPVMDGSGNSIGVTYGEEEDLFSCPESGLSVLICPFTIIGKVWTKTSTFIRTTNENSQNMLQIGGGNTRNPLMLLWIDEAYAKDYGGDLPALPTLEADGSGNIVKDSDAYVSSLSGATKNKLVFGILKAGDNAKEEKGFFTGVFRILVLGLVLIFVIFMIVQVKSFND